MMGDFVPSDSCCGAWFVMRALSFDLVAHARRFLMLTHAQLTLHFGDDQYWAAPKFQDYVRFNIAQAQWIIATLARDLERAERLAAFIAVREMEALRKTLPAPLARDRTALHLGQMGIGMNVMKKCIVLSIALLACGLAQARTQSAQTVNCTGNAAGDTAMLATAAANAGSITLAGNCTVNAATTLNSNTLFDGHGFTITAAAAANWSGGNIAQAFIAANNAVNITIENTNFVWTGATGAVHILAFPSRNAHIKVLNNWSTAAGNLVATIGSTDVLTQGNTCLNSYNACYDHWGGSVDIKDIGNYAHLSATSATGAACLQLTGTTTAGAAAANAGYTAIGNTCYENENAQIGANINGYSRCSGGAADDQVVIADNKFYVAAGTASPVVRITGCANYGQVHHNYVQSDGTTVSSWPAFEVNGPATNWNIDDNIVQNWDGQTGGLDDGVFANKGTGGMIGFNKCYGACSSPLVGNVNLQSSTIVIGNDTGSGAMTLNGTTNLAGVRNGGAASKYVCVDSSGNLVIQTNAC